MKGKIVRIVCIVIYAITALSGFGFAGVYLFRLEFMPYHEVAVGHPWAEVPEGYQVLILALMRVAGGGWLAASLSMTALLLFPCRKGHYWSYIVIPVIGLAVMLPTFIATLHVKFESPANPPYLFAGLISALLILALVLCLFNKKSITR